MKLPLEWLAEFVDVADVATTIVNLSGQGEEQSKHYLRTTPCLASYSKYGDILQNAGPSITKADSEGKLFITGYDKDNECARVEYDGKEYYVYDQFLEYYKTVPGTPGSTPGPI